MPSSTWFHSTMKLQVGMLVFSCKDASWKGFKYQAYVAPSWTSGGFRVGAYSILHSKNYKGGSRKQQVVSCKFLLRPIDSLILNCRELSSFRASVFGCAV